MRAPFPVSASLSLQLQATALLAPSLGDAAVPFVAPGSDIRGCAIGRISTLVHTLRLGTFVTLLLVKTY
jgi:hypothetical protein